MSNQFNLAPKAVPILTSFVLTSAWVPGAILATDTNNFLGLMITYVKGSETGLRVRVEGTADVSLGLANSALTAVNWYQRTSESTTGQQTTAVPQFYEYAASGNYTTVIYPMKADGVRISVSGDTLGGSPGMVSISAITSWA